MLWRFQTKWLAQSSAQAIVIPAWTEERVAANKNKELSDLLGNVLIVREAVLYGYL